MTALMFAVASVALVFMAANQSDPYDRSAWYGASIAFGVASIVLALDEVLL